jgi:protease-4
MPFTADLLSERQRLKGRLAAWQIVAVLAVAAALLVAFVRLGGAGGGRYVARLAVNGIITEDDALDARVAALATDRHAAALIVAIDSPGGSVGGGQALHDAIARVAKVKPVVVVMGGLAASAGYMIAVPASRIFAREGTLTGSIGVLMETGEVSGLLGKLGIATDTLVSGPLKDQPSFLHPTSPAGQKVLQGIVDDLYDQFVTMVAAGRHMDPARVRALADGRAYTGRQALALGLVDAIGGEPSARAWLARAKAVAVALPVRKIAPKRGWLASIGASFLPVLFASAVDKSVMPQSLMLDLPLALWQPSGPGAE